MKQNYITIGALVLAVIAIVISIFAKVPVVNVQPVIQQQCPLGAVSGPSVDFPSFSVNGVETYYYSSPGLNTASSTICSFLTPNATSTLVFGSLKSTKELIAAMEFEIGKSTATSSSLANPTATTTSLGLYVAASATTFTMFASTTPSADQILAGVANAGMPYVFPPHSRLNFKTSSTSPSRLAGSCKAVFIVN